MLMHSCAPQTIQEPDPYALTFPEGIYGFEDVKSFTLLRSTRDDSPIRWLKAADRDLYFPVIDPRLIVPDYDFDLSHENMIKLGATNASQFVVLCIVVLPERVEDMTVNLKSPIVINAHNQRGMQLILDEEEYDIRHPILRRERRTVAHAGNNPKNR
ncbi:MAG: flagellar assembly protein FliW [Clostridiales bacterium]|nr:flagellar assembly protein FliW [Clostridiales bacterium]